MQYSGICSNYDNFPLDESCPQAAESQKAECTACCAIRLARDGLIRQSFHFIIGHTNV